MSLTRDTIGSIAPTAEVECSHDLITRKRVNKMDNLIRRALLGDKNAAKECTDKGIAIPCAWCGKSVAVLTNMAEAVCEDEKDPNYKMFSEYPIYCCDMSKGGCGNYMCYCGYSEYWALLSWNTRPAPPIGRCKDCANRHSSELCECRADDAFCSDFEPKEG